MDTLDGYSLNMLVERFAAEDICNLKKMIELGKKPNGQRLNSHEKEACMQVLLAWECKNLPEEKRSGYIQKKCASKQKPHTLSQIPVTLQK